MNAIEFDVRAKDSFSDTHAELSRQYMGLEQQVDDLTGKMRGNAEAANESGTVLESLGGRGEHALFRIGEAVASGRFQSIPGALLTITHHLGGVVGSLGFVGAAVIAGYELWQHYTEASVKAAEATADSAEGAKASLEGEIKLLEQRNALAAVGVTGQSDDQTKAIATLQALIKVQSESVAAYQGMYGAQSLLKESQDALAGSVYRYNELVKDVVYKNSLSEALKNTKTDAQKLQESIDAANKSLTAQVMTFGMGADAAKVYEFALSGANEKQLAHLKSLSEMHAAEEQSVKDKEAIKTLLKEMETPEMKHNQRIQDLNKFYSEGKLSLQQYNAALKDEADKWDIAAAHSKTYMNSLDGTMAKLAVLERANQKTMGDIATQTANMMMKTFDSLANGIGGAVANAIVYGKSLGDELTTVMKQVAAQVITSLITMEVQQAVMAAVGAGTYRSMAGSQISDEAGVAYAGTYASVVSTMPYGWIYAGAIAAEAAAATEAGGMAFMAAGIAHGGLDDVPAEATYLLDKGERVVSPKQNKDLTNFLDKQSSGGGGSISISELHVHILENATNANAYASMTKPQLRAALGQPLIDALNEMYKIGKRPDFAMQVK